MAQSATVTIQSSKPTAVKLAVSGSTNAQAPQCKGSELVEAVNGARILSGVAEEIEAASGGGFIDFAHVSSLESIQNIINNGFNEQLARAASGGGRVNISGSFFTIKTSQPGAIQAAYLFGLNRALQPAVLIMRLPAEVFESLEGPNVLVLDDKCCRRI